MTGRFSSENRRVDAKRAADKYFLDAKNSASCAIFRGKIFFRGKNQNAHGELVQRGAPGVFSSGSGETRGDRRALGARPGVEPVRRTGGMRVARWLAVKLASRLLEVSARPSNPSGGRVPPGHGRPVAAVYDRRKKPRSAVALRAMARFVPPAGGRTPLPAAAGPVHVLNSCFAKFRHEKGARFAPGALRGKRDLPFRT